jgi:hypothetical protein
VKSQFERCIQNRSAGQTHDQQDCLAADSGASHDDESHYYQWQENIR